jgi:hypothetical protein
MSTEPKAGTHGFGAHGVHLGLVGKVPFALKASIFLGVMRRFGKKERHKDENALDSPSL